MKPAINLLRLLFPASVVAVEEHGADSFEAYTDEWCLVLHSADEQTLENFRGAMRGIAHRQADSLMDVLDAEGGPTIERLIIGIDPQRHVVQAQYLVSFGAGGASGFAFPKKGYAFDVGPVNNFLQSLRLDDAPRPEDEVLPAWRAYQCRGYRPGTPLAKFRLSAECAPIRIGDESVDSPTWEPFLTEEYERGGRQLAPGLFEFYAKDDTLTKRLDLWLDEPPFAAGREVVFDASLDLPRGRLRVGSFDLTFDAPVSPGDYDVSVTVVNRGCEDERFLVDSEVLARDDLERYEVTLRRRGEPPARP